MARKAYTVFVIPSAHKLAADVVMAIVNGDDPAGSQAFTRPASADGEEPATHYYGGMPTTATWESLVDNLADDPVQPVGGWPVSGVGDASVSLQDATSAAAAIHQKRTVTQDRTEPSPLETLSEALNALGLVEIVPDP